MRVMTINLLNGDASPSDFERSLARYEPDLLLAQELAPNSGEVIERHFSHGVVKPTLDYRGKAIAASFPIAVEELDFPYRSILRGHSSDLDLEVLAVHLANPIDGWRGRLPERRAQVRVLEGLISDPRRRIVGGDFNSTPAWLAYRRIVRHVDDTVADLAAAEGWRPRATWGWRPGWPAMLRIDHVFAHGYRATGADVVKVRGSDHKALIVDLTPA